jgi:hypothetical protein
MQCHQRNLNRGSTVQDPLSPIDRRRNALINETRPTFTCIERHYKHNGTASIARDVGQR